MEEWLREAAGRAFSQVPADERELLASILEQADANGQQLTWHGLLTGFFQNLGRTPDDARAAADMLLSETPTDMRDKLS